MGIQHPGPHRFALDQGFGRRAEAARGAPRRPGDSGGRDPAEKGSAAGAAPGQRVGVGIRMDWSALTSAGSVIDGFIERIDAVETPKKVAIPERVSPALTT